MTKIQPEAPGGELLGIGHSERHYGVIVDHGVTLEDVLRPGFWRKQCEQLKRSPMCRISVRCRDNTWEADLRCMSAGDGFAKMRVLWEWKPPAREGRPPKLDKDHDVEWVSTGWRVRHKETNEVLVDKHVLRDDAIVEANRLRARVFARADDAA
jgi:hypothetical protein